MWAFEHIINGMAKILSIVPGGSIILGKHLAPMSKSIMMSTDSIGMEVDSNEVAIREEI